MQPEVVRMPLALPREWGVMSLFASSLFDRNLMYVRLWWSRLSSRRSTTVFDLIDIESNIYLKYISFRVDF